MNVKNIIASSVNEFSSNFSQIIDTGFQPTLAIIFSDQNMNNSEVVKILETHNIEYIGCSSSGEIVQGKVCKNSISASFFEMDKSKFKVLKQNNQSSSSLQAGEELAKVALENFDNPSFISLFTMTVNGESWLDGIKNELTYDPLIYAGMASDEVNLKPHLFTSEGPAYDSFHTIILDKDKIEIDGFAIAGWEAIGTEYQITKSEDNIVYEINNEPALDFFRKFFGFEEDPLNKDVSVHVNAQYPLQLQRENEKVLRAPVDANLDEKSLILAGPVDEGEKFRFSVAPGFSVIQDTIDEFSKFKEGKDKPDAMILFSCKARHWAFGPMIEEEVEALQNLWDIPYHGFFTFGEIGRNKKGSTQFFNETCCLVTLKDK